MVKGTNSIKGVNIMPNFNVNLNNFKEKADPILLGARTAQSVYRKNSISALAKDLVMQYPVIMSADISTENALVVTKGLERQFACLQMLVFSADTAFGVDPGKNAGVRDLISKYHSNSDTPDMINYAGNVISNLGSIANRLDSLESASDDSYIKIKNAKEVDIAVDNAVISTMWSRPNDGLTMESVNSLYQPYNAVIDTIASIADGVESRGTRATEDFSDFMKAVNDIGRDLNKQNPNSFDVNKTIRKTREKETKMTRVKTDTTIPAGVDIQGKPMYAKKHEEKEVPVEVNGREITTDIYQRQTRTNDTAKMLRIEKEYTALEPTILEVEFYVTQGDNSRIQKALIGVSAMPRVIPSDVLRANVIKAVQQSHKGFNFIQYTKGERKLVRDFIFNISNIKDNALAKSKYDKWFAALKKRKNNARAFNAGNYGRSGTINPLASIVLSSNDVTAIKTTANIDLTNPAHAIKLMDSLYLLCLVIIDENAGTISTLLDGQRDFMDTTMAAMSKSNKDKSLNYANPKELLALLGRM